MAKKGKIIQIVGPVVDVAFDAAEDGLPEIYDALEITRPNGDVIVIECEQHIGENTVRCISMESTDGLKRGMEVVATGAPIVMPNGDSSRGRLLNVIG